MHLVPRGRVSVGSVSPPRGASLALSGMVDPDPCISPSARWSATGIQPGAVLTTPQAFEEEEGPVLEDNACTGDVRSMRGDPGQAYPFMCV